MLQFYLLLALKEVEFHHSFQKQDSWKKNPKNPTDCLPLSLILTLTATKM